MFTKVIIIACSGNAGCGSPSGVIFGAAFRIEMLLFRPLVHIRNRSLIPMMSVGDNELLVLHRIQDTLYKLRVRHLPHAMDNVVLVRSDLEGQGSA